VWLERRGREEANAAGEEMKRKIGLSWRGEEERRGSWLERRGRKRLGRAGEERVVAGEEKNKKIGPSWRGEEERRGLRLEKRGRRSAELERKIGCERG